MLVLVFRKVLYLDFIKFLFKENVETFKFFLKFFI